MMDKVRAAVYIAWLEKRDWTEFKVNDVVKYQGGIWVIHARLDGTLYTLRDPGNEWSRLNVDRMYLVPVDM